MTIRQIRDGLATNLATITGLRTSAYYPDQINPPMAIVDGLVIDYDAAFDRGTDSYTFEVLVVVHRSSERQAQAELDDYCSTIKTAIEADQTLGGSVAGLRVTNMRGYSPLIVGETTYQAASFAVMVVATP